MNILVIVLIIGIIIGATRLTIVQEFKRSLKAKGSWKLMRTMYPDTTDSIIGILILMILWECFADFFYRIYYEMASPVLLSMVDYIIHNKGIILFALLPVILFKIFLYFKVDKKIEYPIVGIPDKNNITALLALFKVRCIEMSRIYCTINYKQKKAAEDGNNNHWAESLLLEHLDKKTDVYGGPFGDYDNAQHEQNKERVSELLKDKFHFDEGRYTFYKNESKARNLFMILKLENAEKEQCDEIRLLLAIRPYGFFTTVIDALIKEYEIFHMQPAAIFISESSLYEYFKFKTLKSHYAINAMWNEIITSLKSSLVFLKMQNETLGFDIEKIMQEIELLNKLQNDQTIFRAYPKTK